MSLANLLIDLKNLIGPGVTVDDSGLTTWINDSLSYMYDAIIRDNPDYFAKSAVADIASSQQEYVLPTDFEKMLMVNISYGGDWRRAEPLPNIDKIPNFQLQGTNMQFSPGRPYYYIVGNGSGGRNVGLAPIPDASVNSGLKIWYIYTPSELALSSDIPSLPAKFHHLIKLGAYANYLDQDDQHPAAQAMRSQFEQRIGNMVESVNDAQVEEPKSIQITSNYDLYVDQEYV